MAAPVRLADIGAGRWREFGHKAVNLARLSRAGFQVPDAVVVPAAQLWGAARKSGAARRIARLEASPVNRAALIGSALCETRLGFLEGEFMARLPAGETLVVRSSSTLEDRCEGSAAGLLTSVLGVRPAGLADAVRTVWVSGFSPLLLALHDPVPPDHLSVIVQREIHPTAAGVCFSRHPHDPARADEIVVESVAGSPRGLVDGTADGTRYVLARTGPLGGQPDRPLSAGQLDTLRRAARSVEALWECPVDIEFAFAGRELHLLQARPLTGPKAAARAGGAGAAGAAGTDAAGDRLRTVSPDVLDDALPVATGALAKMLARRADKHRHVRRAAREAGVRIAGEWLVAGAQPTPHGLARLVAHLEQLVSTDHVTLGLPRGKQRLVHRADLYAALAAELRSGDSVYVADVVVGTTSGYAARREDGTLLVEYVAGAVGGLKFGAEPFSVLVLGSDGTRLVDRVLPTRGRWSLHEQPPGFGPAGGDATVPDPLDDAAVAEIARVTDAMAARFGDVRIEWIRTADGGIALWDLSVERSTALQALRLETVSPGSAAGRVVVIRDPAPLEALLAERNVVPDPDFYRRHGSDQAAVLRAELLGAGEPPIVVTPRPVMCLALLLGHVAGFVFDDAPLLCHLAIILRESGVPAVVSSGVTGRVVAGGAARIADGQFQLAEAPAAGTAEG
ncbi:PEP/pyruvate-binding domain-containing protein [Streptomyces sp. CA-111067]|uniref:PEP/pyruvate-binding domain-containing protein n=1 Tax=Streptomyces sp. CA-111067 TaxID=3240046 RepID=UPI003D96437F